MHELIYYYLRERESHNNIDIKYLVATNNYEWFVFDEKDFDKAFYRTKIKKDYETCIREGKDSEYFYSNIAKPFLAKEKPNFQFTHFDLREKKDRSKLRALYKFFSPEYLLKQPLANDSNSLNRSFTMNSYTL